MIKNKKVLATCLVIFTLFTSFILVSCGDKKNNNPTTPVNFQIIFLPDTTQETTTSVPNGSFYHYNKPQNATTKMPYAPTIWTKNTQDSAISGVISLEEEFYNKYKNFYGNIPYPLANNTGNPNSDKRALLIKSDKDTGSNIYSLDNIPVKFPSDSKYVKLEIIFRKYGFTTTSNLKFTLSALRDINLTAENKENGDSPVWQKETFYLQKSSLLDQNVLKKITITLVGKGSVIVDSVDIVETTEESFNNAAENKKISLNFPNPTFNPAMASEYSAINLTDSTSYKTVVRKITGEAGNIKDFDPTDHSLDDYVIQNKPNDINSAYAVYSTGKQTDGYKKFAVDILSKQHILILPGKNYTIALYTYANYDINYQTLALSCPGNSLQNAQTSNFITSPSPIGSNTNTWVKHTLEIKGGKYPIKTELHILALSPNDKNFNFILFSQLEIQEVGTTSETLTSTLINTDTIDTFNQKIQDSTELNTAEAIYKNHTENAKVTIMGQELSQILLSNTSHNTNIVETTAPVIIKKDRFYYFEFFAKLDNHDGSKPTLSLTTKDKNAPSNAQNITFTQIDNSYSNLNFNGYKLFVAYLQGSKHKNIEYNISVTYGTGSRLNNKNLAKGDLYITLPQLSEIKEIDYIKESLHLYQTQKLKHSLVKNASTDGKAINFGYSYNDTYSSFANLYSDFFNPNKQYYELKDNVPLKLNGWDLTASDLQNRYFSDNFGNYSPTAESPASLNTEKWNSTDLKPLFKLDKEKEPINIFPNKIKDKILSVSTNSVLALTQDNNISTKDNTLTLYPNSVLALSFSAMTNADDVKININIDGNVHELITLRKIDMLDESDENLKNIKYTNYVVYIATAPFEYQNATIEIKIPNTANSIALFDKNFELNAANVLSYKKAEQGFILNKDVASNFRLSYINPNVVAGAQKTTPTTDLSNLPGIYNDYLANDSLLTLNVTEQSKRTHTLTNKNLISLNAQSYYHLRGYYKYTGTGAADITLSSSSLSEDTVFRSIQAKTSPNQWELNSATWTPIDFYFSTGFSKLSFTLSVSIGKFNAKYDTVTAQGKVEVSHFVLSELSETMFNEQDTEKLNFQTEDFDLVKPNNANNDNYNLPISWNANSNNFKTEDSEHGVLDLSNETKVRAVINSDILSDTDYNSLKSLGNALFILNKKNNVSISYSNAFTLNEEKLYKIDFETYTNYNQGAYFILANNAKEFGFGNVIKSQQNIKLFKNLTRTTYSFVIKTEKNMVDKTIVLKLGLNNNDTPNALLFFDKFKITEISNEDEFTNANESETAVPVTLKAKTETAPSTPDKNNTGSYDKNNNQMIFLYASAGAISALLVIVIVVFVIKKYFKKNKKQTFKKKQKSKNKSSRDMFS